MYTNFDDVDHPTVKRVISQVDAGCEWQGVMLTRVELTPKGPPSMLLMAGVLDSRVATGSSRGPKACVSSWSNGSSDVSMLYSAAHTASGLCNEPSEYITQPVEYLKCIWKGMSPIVLVQHTGKTSDLLQGSKQQKRH